MVLDKGSRVSDLDRRVRAPGATSLQLPSDLVVERLGRQVEVSRPGDGSPVGVHVYLVELTLVPEAREDSLECDDLGNVHVTLYSIIEAKSM